MEPIATPKWESIGTTGQAAAKAGEGSPGVDLREFECIQCGYALGGLPIGGVCPECARPVADSLGRWELKYAERRHLKQISLGLWLIISGTGWFGFGFFVLDVLFLAQLFDAPGHVILRYSLAAAVFVAGIGVWLFTRAEPLASGRWRSVASRRIARAASVCYAVAVSLLMYLYSFLSYLIRWYVLPGNQLGAFAIMGQWDGLISYGFPALVVCSRALLLAALMHRARGLAARAGDAPLVRGCELFRWILPLLAVLGGAWVFVPSRDETLYVVSRLMTPIALVLACWALWCVQRHIRGVLAADSATKD